MICFGRHQLTLTAFSIGLLSGCASVPDVDVSYRPVKWALSVTVAHTITCNRDNTVAIVQRGATFQPIYSAAQADSRFRVRLKDLNAFFADSDITLALTDDGRLKSINQSATGQGETIVKTAISAVAALGATAALTAPVQPTVGTNLFTQNIFERQVPAAPSSICNVLRSWSTSPPDQLLQVSVAQTALVRQGGPPVVNAQASDDQAALVQQLKNAGIDVAARVTVSLASEELQPIGDLKADVARNEVALPLQRMVAMRASVADGNGQIGSKSAPVPTSNTFVLPIPKAALFGKQSFSIVLGDSGRISSIGYGRNTGAPGALSAGSSLASAGVTEDTADVAALKAASDLIAQQQRFNACRLKPADCK